MRWAYLLVLLIPLALLIGSLYFLVMFFQAWGDENLVEMVGNGVMLLMLSTGGAITSRSER